MGVLMDFNQIGKHCEVKADSTLNNMKKEELIQYIRTLEHNYNVSVDFNIQQVKNFQMMEDRIVKEIEQEKLRYFLNPWSLIIISCCNHFVYAVCRYV